MALFIFKIKEVFTIPGDSLFWASDIQAFKNGTGAIGGSLGMISVANRSERCFLRVLSGKVGRDGPQQRSQHENSKGFS